MLYMYKILYKNYSNHKKKKLHTSIISESIKFLVKTYEREVIKMLSKILLYTIREQEGHDGPVSLHWLIREIHSYQTLHYLGIGLKHKTPYKD